MKRLFTLILGVALMVSMHSCQRNEIDNGQIVEKKLKITAVIEGKIETRVSYTVDNEANTITPAWEVDDEVFGFDSNNNTFTLKVTAIGGAEGATLEPVGSYSPAEGTTVYAIFAPGYSVSNLSGNTLEVNLAAQGGVLDGSTPALMCATATVNADSELNLSFANQTAIIGVKKFQLSGVTAPTDVTSMTVNGVHTTGTFQVNNDVLELVPGTTVGSITATHPGTGWETDNKGICTAGVYFAAMPTDETPEITLNAVANGTKYVNVSAITASAMEPGKYYYMSKKLGGAVADVDGLPYLTIDEAWTVAKAATAPCIVTLLKDCEATARLSLDNNDTGSGTVTLDLNGCTLTAPASDYGLYVTGRTLMIQDSGVDGAVESEASSNYTLYVGTGANVTLNAGTITNSVYRAVRIDNSGNFTMNGGTVSAGTYGIALAGSGVISVTGGSISGSRAISSITLQGDVTFTGTLSVSGGTLVGESSYGIYTGDGEINISGGAVFSASSNAVASTGTVNITGGTFTSTSTSSATILIGATGTISGGKFNSNALSTVATSTNGGTAYVTGGLHSRAVQVKFAVDDNDNEYVNLLNTDNDTKATYPFAVGLVSGNPIVDHVEQGSNVWNHASLEGAFINAGHRAVVSSATNTTITQVADATISGTINVNSGNLHSIILDLNGKVVSATGVTPMIDAASDLTIMDSDGAGELSTTGNVALNVTGGITNINSGSLVGGVNAANVAADATLNVNNGYLYGAENGDDITGAEGANVTLSAGWFRNEPSADYLASGTAAISVSETHNTKTYNWTIGVETATVTVNGVEYASLGAAIAAANEYNGEDGTVTIKLLEDILHNEQITLTNVNGKPIVLDLNGNTLSTETQSFLTAGGTLTITDSGQTKGKITSSASKVLDLTTASATVTLDGCVIESTKENGTAWNSDVAVNVAAVGASLNIINGAKVYTTKHLSTLRAYTGTVTITNSELSSGTESNGWYVVVGLNTATVTVNSGSFYTSGDGNSSTFHIGNENATMTVNNGYFFSNGRAVSAGGAYSSNITLNGGYYNKLPSNTPSYGTSLSMQAIDPAATHAHATIGETLNYGYQVKEAPIVYAADVNGEKFTDFADAVSAANDYNDEGNVTITLLGSFTYDAVITLRNSNSKRITLDLNGQTLTAGVARFIQGSKFTITDTVGTGKIESAFNEIIYPNVKNGSATLDGCKIVSTIAKGSYYYSNRAVACFADNCTLTITGNTVIEANQTCVYCASTTAANSPKVVIESATLNSSGSYCIYTAATGVVTINGGTFHSAAYVCGYIGASTASFIINHGYFSRNAGTGNLLSGASGFSYTLNGGFYSKALSFSDSNIIELDEPVTVEDITYTHAHISEVSGAASVQATTGDPAASYGTGQTNGVTF